jgi:glycosyltransferase involved in cell wall biosynthesis
MNHSIYDRNELINKQENVAPNQQCKIAFLAEGVRQTVGSEVAVAQLASALGRLGFRVTICILRNEDRNSFQQSNPHVEVITLPSIEGRLLSKYIKAKALLPLIEKVNANIYVITSFSFIALAGYLSRPTITYDMGVVPAYGNSISFHISINMLRFLNMYANKRATRVVTISRYLATKMSWYLPLNKIDVIHCGVDQLKKEYIKNLTKVEARNFLGLPQEFPIILTVGRLAPEARYKNVLDSLKLGAILLLLVMGLKKNLIGLESIRLLS